MKPLDEQPTFSFPPAPPPSDVGWRERAACIGADPKAFDAGKGANPPDRAVVAAWLNCARCPVIEQCREAADRLADPGVVAGQWRRKDNPLASKLYVTDLLTPAMRQRFEQLRPAKAAA